MARTAGTGGYSTCGSAATRLRASRISPPSCIPSVTRCSTARGCSPGDTLLDVGAGDGLIAFGALERLGPSGRVIFSDISADLVEHCRKAATAEELADRCRFVIAPADCLEGVDDGSVDVVTTRSVLIYVKDKAAALREFYRVLRPGGRISLAEPINVLMSPYDPDLFGG